MFDQCEQVFIYVYNIIKTIIICYVSSKNKILNGLELAQTGVVSADQGLVANENNYNDLNEKYDNL